MNTGIVCVVAVGSALCAVPVLGQQGIQSFTDGTTFRSFADDGDTIGWAFRPSVNITLTSLGYWDGDSSPMPLMANIPVGVWDSGGNLLASTVVMPSTPLSGAWRFVGISGVPLAGGADYYIGAYVAFDNTVESGYKVGVNNLVIGSGITYLGATRDAFGPAAGMAFPSIIDGGVIGRFGPNFVYVVPGPGVVVVLGLGVGLGGRRRRGECGG